MNLLMVNDEVITVETMKAEIEWETYGITKVFTAYDVEQAKECISRNAVDLILCDIEMPGENGLALREGIRSRSMDIECIFLTCHASFQYAQKAIGLGCQDYILIPAKYEEIGNAVQKVVNRIREKRESVKIQEYGNQVIREKVESAVEGCEKTCPKEVVADTVKFILNHLGASDLSVNKIAETLHFHPAYLNRIFKKEKGTVISQYIIGERMRLAARLLETNRMSSHAVSEAVGYSSYPSFNMTFRKYYGCAPAQYSEQQKRKT